MSGKGVAMVTGGGSGIGRAAALALQGEGYSVVLTGRRQAPLEETTSMKADGGGEMLAIPTDVTDPQSVEAAFARTVETFGRLDLLFNNAGTNAPGKTIDELSLDDWNAVIDTNLKGSILCARAAFKVMRQQDPQGGRIINNGSISAYVPRPLSAPYTTSKHAITGLTRSLSLDGRPYDIACGQIDIGNAASDMWLDATADGAERPQANGTVAMEPIMDVSHVANAVLYMAGLPLQANVQFMTVMATKMPFIGRG